MTLRKDLACCQNCGHVTCYNKNGRRFECVNGKTVMPEMVCDRFQKDLTSAEIVRKMDREIKRLEQFEDGQYQLKSYPPIGQNYRMAVYGG